MGAMEFYEEMAKAIKARDHAKNMVMKWMKQSEDAEAKIEELVAQQEPKEEA